MYSRYKYSPDELFEDTQESLAIVKAFRNRYDHVQAQPEFELTAPVRICVEYLKCKFEIGKIFSMPKVLFDLAVAGAPPHDQLEAIDLVDAMKDAVFHAPDIEITVMFQIVDARPENKPLQRTLHVARDRTRVNVLVFGITQREDDVY